MLDFPRNQGEFDAQFGGEEACRAYLVRLRWPDGFRCPACGQQKAWPVRRRLFECAACRRQTSVTAGTIFQDTRSPLTVWFRAMWAITSQKTGTSALTLQQVLGLGSYQTARTRRRRAARDSSTTSSSRAVRCTRMAGRATTACRRTATGTGLRTCPSTPSRRTSCCHARGEDPLRGHVELLRCSSNFIRPHRALRFGRETRTPAMQAGLVNKRLAWSDVFTACGLPLRVVVALVHVAVTVQPTESDAAELPTRCSPSALTQAA